MSATSLMDACFQPQRQPDARILIVDADGPTTMTFCKMLEHIADASDLEGYSCVSHCSKEGANGSHDTRPKLLSLIHI